MPPKKGDYKSKYFATSEQLDVEEQQEHQNESSYARNRCVKAMTEAIKKKTLELNDQYWR